MKKKTILMGLFTSIIYGIVLFSMVSCSNPHREQSFQPIESNLSNKAITIETLNEGYFHSGVHKISVDSSEYILVITAHGAAIIKHN